MKMELERNGFTITYTDPKAFEKAKKLQTMAEEVIQHYRRAKKALCRWLEHVRDCGEALHHAKKFIGRGEWKQFIKTHLDDLSVETAQDYMIVFKEWENPLIVEARNNGVEINSIRKFMELLHPKPDASTDEETEKEEIPTVGEARKKLVNEYRHEINALDDKEVLLLAYSGAVNASVLWNWGYEKLKDDIRAAFKRHGFNYDPYHNDLTLERLEKDCKTIMEMKHHKERSKAVA